MAVVCCHACIAQDCDSLEAVEVQTQVSVGEVFDERDLRLTLDVLNMLELVKKEVGRGSGSLRIEGYMVAGHKEQRWEF